MQWHAFVAHGMPWQSPTAPPTARVMATRTEDTETPRARPTATPRQPHPMHSPKNATYSVKLYQLCDKADGGFHDLVVHSPRLVIASVVACYHFLLRWLIAAYPGLLHGFAMTCHGLPFHGLGALIDMGMACSPLGCLGLRSVAVVRHDLLRCHAVVAAVGFQQAGQNLPRLPTACDGMLWVLPGTRYWSGDIWWFHIYSGVSYYMCTR